MKAISLTLFSFLCSITLYSQGRWLVGIESSYNANNIVLNDPAIQVTTGTSLSIGALITYLPADKKPGIKFSVTQTQFSFSELVNEEKITYKQSGVGFQFLSHLFLEANKTRFFIDAGPGLFYMPKAIEVSETDSVLPDFQISNLNKVHVLAGAGGGITQQIGKIHLSVYSSFTFDASKVYPKMDGLSNLLILRIGGSLQISLNPKKEK